MSDKQKRDAAVDAFAAEMKRRLDQVADQGKTGWDGDYPSSALRQEMRGDITRLVEGAGPDERRRLPIDLANRAMMLWFREV